MRFDFRKTERRSNDSPVLTRLYNEVRKYPPLTIDDEVELFKRYRSGDLSARDKIVNHNLRFVITVARSYSRTTSNIEDNIGAGNIGLLKAIEEYDYTKGFKFITFAVNYIKGYMFHQFKDFSTIHVPIIKSKGKTKQIKELLEEGLSVSEISVITGVDKPSIRKIKNGPLVVHSLYSEVPNVGELTLLDLIPVELDEVNLDSEYNKKYLNFLLSKLTDKQSSALKMMYGVDGVDYTASYVIAAEKLGVTRERVRQLVNEGLAKVRKYAGA